MLSFNFEPYLIAICSGFLFLVIFLICRRRPSKVMMNHLLCVWELSFNFHNLLEQILCSVMSCLVCFIDKGCCRQSYFTSWETRFVLSCTHSPLWLLLYTTILCFRPEQYRRWWWDWFWWAWRSVDSNKRCFVEVLQAYMYTQTISYNFIPSSL